MMDCVKVDIKLFLDGDANQEFEELIPVFHSWIQEQSFDELLIDVADYRHVPDGPGVMLITHEAQYALDFGQGRPGLLYSRRREPAASDQERLSMADRLRSVIDRALAACLRLESEPTLQGRYRFRGDELRLRFNDRLAVPNTDAAFAESSELLEPLLQQLYPDTPVRVERVSAEAAHLSIIVKAATSPNIVTLLKRLGPIGV